MSVKCLKYVKNVKDSIWVMDQKETVIALKVNKVEHIQHLAISKFP